LGLYFNEKKVVFDKIVEREGGKLGNWERRHPNEKEVKPFGKRDDVVIVPYNGRCATSTP